MLNKFLTYWSKRFSRKNLYKFLRAELNSVRDREKILSVGAGGEIESLIRESISNKGCEFVTFDISRERNPIILGDICNANFLDEFDVIVLAEVLEHVLYPHVACHKVYEALREKGRLILTAPFIFPLHDRPHDYWRFTRYGLEHLLKDAGFSDVLVRERNGWTEAIAVLLWRVVNTPGHSRLARYISASMAILFSPIGWLLSLVWPHDFLTTGYVATAIKTKQ